MTSVVKECLLEYLKMPRTRSELSTFLNLEDRTVREKIKELTREGHMIIHDDETNTYKLTDNIDEIERYLRKIDSYSTSLYFNYLQMRRIVAKARGQRLVKVRQHFRKLGIEIDESQIRMGI